MTCIKVDHQKLHINPLEVGRGESQLSQAPAATNETKERIPSKSLRKHEENEAKTEMVSQGADPSILETDQRRREAAEGEKLLKLWDPTRKPIILPVPAHAKERNIRIDKLKTCREKARQNWDAK